jgi:hypothetical protein
MGRYVCYLADRDRWFEFSSVVEAPVTGLMTEEEFVEHYTRLYGEMAAEASHQDGMRARMARARKNGTSDMVGRYDTFEKWLEMNTLNTYRSDKEDETAWPGMDQFMKDYFIDDDSSDEVVGLPDRPKPIDA